MANPLKQKLRYGRNPSSKTLAEARRLAAQYASCPQNHPRAVSANHAELSHINTYGLLPEYYVDQVFRCRDCGVEEIWLAEDQKWYYEVAKGHIDANAVRCHSCRRKKRT